MCVEDPFSQIRSQLLFDVPITVRGHGKGDDGDDDDEDDD